MVKPDYDGGSLLNLMTTLGLALGLPPSGYQGLSATIPLDSSSLAGSRHIVLLVVDGLGDELLEHHAPGSFLSQHRIGRLTSVFPSTTASAIPTFLTSLPPRAHGLTGWHMWFEEIQEILAVLPMKPRGTPSGAWHPSASLQPERLFGDTSLSRQLAGRTWNIIPQDIVDSAFNRFHTEGARRIGYQGTAGLFAAIETAVAEAARTNSSGPPSYIHAYYPTLDALMHEVGTRDQRVPARLAKVAGALAECCRRLAGQGVTFLVTADHGFIDAPPEKLITLDQHPALAALLNRPLCGERRIAYAYVDHNRQLDFAAYVKEHLGHACDLFTSQEFMDDSWLGPGPAHPQLASRLGDFVLLMKDDWTIKDWLATEKHYDQLGVHGGASPQEMHVPLILIPAD